MRILVTGSSGLVGSRVVAQLKHRYDITTLDIRPPVEAGLRHKQADLLDAAAARAAVRDVDAVVHLAGIPHPLNDPPELVYRVNTVGTYHVLLACAEQGIGRMVFMSSESTLGFAFSRSRLWPLRVPIDEGHPLRPEDPYGLSKVAGESACRGMTEATGMETVCLRAPWIWVPDPKELEMYRSLIREYPKWHRNMWAYIHIDDVVQAIDKALTATRIRHAAVFIAAAENWTGRESRDLLAEFYPETSDISPAFGGRSSLISSAQAGRILGFRPERTLHDFGLSYA